jgi:hypothetical protein
MLLNNRLRVRIRNEISLYSLSLNRSFDEEDLLAVLTYEMEELPFFDTCLVFPYHLVFCHMDVVEGFRLSDIRSVVATELKPETSHIPAKCRFAYQHLPEGIFAFCGVEKRNVHYN